MTQSQLNLLGKTVGKFEILAELGRSAMSVVYKARQTDLQRDVALKILLPELTSDPINIDRFRREANNAARLFHPNIVPVYEVGVLPASDDPRPLHYLSMQLIAGRTLKDLLQSSGALSIERTLQLLEPVGRALDYAHQNKVVHRDIKPSNILIDPDGHVYLADFGLARDINLQAGATIAGTIMGTPEYMSPEQADGSANVGPATDIYALGIVLYEMLTGKLPFSGDSPLSVLYARLIHEPVRPRQYRGDLPMATEQVVLKALARDPTKRYQSAAELLAALRAVPLASAGAVAPTLVVTGGAAQAATAALQPPPVVDPTRAAVDKTLVIGGGAAPVNVPPPPVPAPTPTSVPYLQPTPTAAPSRRWIWISLATFAALVVLICGGGGAYFVVTSAQQANATATAVVQQTATGVAVAAAAASKATAIASARIATSTAEAVASTAAAATAEAQQAADATATAEVAAAADATQTAEAVQPTSPPAVAAMAWDGKPAAGPMNGTLKHVADKVAVKEANVNLRDMVASIRFFNPYNASEHSWDYGLTFRDQGGDKQYRMIVTSDKDWELKLANLVNGQSQFTSIFSGTVKSLDVSPNGANDLRLFVYDSTAYFYINDQPIAYINNLSGSKMSGDVAAATGFFTDDANPGATTRFENFTVWPLAITSQDAKGEIQHQEDDKFQFYDAKQDQRDFMTAVVFHNPYDRAQRKWDYGIVFRDNQEGFYALVMTSDKAWTLWQRPKDKDDVKVASGTIDNLNVDPTGSNVLLLVASGQTGLLYANDKYIATLDLTALSKSGDIDLLTGYYTGHEINGKSTPYEGFTVIATPR